MLFRRASPAQALIYKTGLVQRHHLCTASERGSGRRPHTVLLHPGEVLREEFLKPMQLSALKPVARTCGVPRTRIERIANGQTGITADTALRLGRALGTSPQLWLNLQNEFDLRTARTAAGQELDKIRQVRAA